MLRTEQHRPVTVSQNAATVTVTVNRPESLNALDMALTSELLAVLRDVAADATIRVVCLAGAGRAFCSGADLHEMRDLRSETLDGRPDLRRALIERFNPITLVLREMPKPVVAAVNGPCVGIGVGYALACDYVIAAESAYFLLPFVNLGLVPDGGALAFLSARIGAARAAGLTLFGRRLPAQQALGWGLINETVADGGLATRLDDVLGSLDSGPTQAYAAVKRQINAWLYPRLAEQLALEADLQGGLTATDDFQRGLDAFARKATPKFCGT